MSLDESIVDDAATILRSLGGARRLKRLVSAESVLAADAEPFEGSACGDDDQPERRKGTVLEVT